MIDRWLHKVNFLLFPYCFWTFIFNVVEGSPQWFFLGLFQCLLLHLCVFCMKNETFLGRAIRWWCPCMFLTDSRSSLIFWLRSEWRPNRSKPRWLWNPKISPKRSKNPSHLLLLHRTSSSSLPTNVWEPVCLKSWRNLWRRHAPRRSNRMAIRRNGNWNVISSSLPSFFDHPLFLADDDNDDAGSASDNADDDDEDNNEEEEEEEQVEDEHWFPFHVIVFWNKCHWSALCSCALKRSIRYNHVWDTSSAMSQYRCAGYLH